MTIEDRLKIYCREYYNYNYPCQHNEETGASMMPHIIDAAKRFYELGQKDCTSKQTIRDEIFRRMTEDYTSGDDMDEIAQGVCASLLTFIDQL